MSLQQLEAFLALAQSEPALQHPLAQAPDAAAVAAIATAAGFAVSTADLLEASGELPEVIRMVEIVSLAPTAPQSELDAFLQQVEADADLQRVLAAAPDAEGVAAVARIAGYAVSAEDLWAASDEIPETLQQPDLVLEFWPDLGGAEAEEPLQREPLQEEGPDGMPSATASGAAPHASGEPATAAPPSASGEPATGGASERLQDPWASRDSAG